MLRAWAGFTLPLTGDEAYYWEWSRRLAFGYVDHPPLVAWLIALFAPLGATPGIVRLPFELCGVAATLALAACATQLSGRRSAGDVAALLFVLAPLTSVAFGSATPDGPYLAAWCIALWLAARAFAEPRPAAFAWLGCALGAALLSRVFAVALLAGIVAVGLEPQRRSIWRNGFLWTLAVAALLFLPYVGWNATHHWESFSFALVARHVNEGFSLLRPLTLAAAALGAFSPGILLAVCVAARRPAASLIGWTALPLALLLVVLALGERVELYWFFGPFASLCAGAGLAYEELGARARRMWAALVIAPAALLLPLLFAAALFPAPLYRFAVDHLALHLRNSGPFEIFTYRPLALDAARLAAAKQAWVMTDGYGFSSVLDFEAGIAPVVIGYDMQGRESRRWYDQAAPPPTLLFVDKEALATRPDFVAQLGRACGRTEPGPILSYAYAGAPPRNYYLTWCEAPRPAALRILNWTPGA